MHIAVFQLSQLEHLGLLPWKETHIAMIQNLQVPGWVLAHPGVTTCVVCCPGVLPIWAITYSTSDGLVAQTGCESCLSWSLFALPSHSGDTGCHDAPAVLWKMPAMKGAEATCPQPYEWAWMWVLQPRGSPGDAASEPPSMLLPDSWPSETAGGFELLSLEILGYTAISK